MAEYGELSNGTPFFPNYKLSLERLLAIEMHTILTILELC